MKPDYLRYTAPAAALLGLAVTPALAQRVPTPEQRIERLERQLRQVQRQVFPKGPPAATAGFSDEPAATATSVRTLDERINGLERQMAEILRHAEENGHKVSTLEAELARLRTEQDQRLKKLETAPTATVATATAEPAEATAAKSKIETAKASTEKPTVTLASVPAIEPAEVAYDEGYNLWKSGKYDQAITSLRATASSFPDHRRASWANNLAGRALLDKGQPRAAAEALLANYRKNPKGERAADSLYYLGQSLMKLGQPGQACKAYAELEDVYGDKMRGELKTMLPKAKSDAQCS